MCLDALSLAAVGCTGVETGCLRQVQMKGSGSPRTSALHRPSQSPEGRQAGIAGVGGDGGMGPGGAVSGPNF